MFKLLEVQALNSLKRFIKNQINITPAAARIILPIYRPLAWLNFSYYLWQNARRSRDQLSMDPNCISWVSPRSIVHRQIRKDRINGITWKRMGTVEDGDWDTLKEDFSGHIAFQSIKAHFTESTPWKETSLYKTTVQEIQDGLVRWNCTSVQMYEDRLSELDSLYITIKQTGYKSQEELIEDKRSLDPISHIKFNESQRLFDEVVLNIDRNGNFLFIDGKHRLSLAK